MAHYSFSIQAPYRWLIQRTQLWPRMLIIAGVLIGCTALPLSGSRLLQLLPLGLLVIVVSLWGLMQRSALGIVTVLFTALIIPSPHLPGGFNFAVLHVMLLLGLWVFQMIVQRRPIVLLPSRTTLPLLAFVGIAILSFVTGQLRWFLAVEPAPLDAQLGGLAIFVLSAGAFFLVACRVVDLLWLQRLTWVFLALAALFIAGWLIPGLGGFTSQLFQRHATANSVFWIWLVALAFSQALFNRHLRPHWRLALGLLVVATLYVAYFRSSGWKSGYLPPLVAVVTMVACRSWRLALLMAVAGIFPALYLISEAIATDQYSYSTRLEAWLLVLEMVKTSPLLGFGPANYYWYTPLFPIRGWEVVFNSHSQYVDIIAQTGILGLLCFFWFAWEVWRLGFRLRNRVPPGFAQAYVYGALGGWAGTLASGILVDWFLPFAYNIALRGFRASVLVWLFIGGLASIEQMYRREVYGPEIEASTARRK